MLSGTTDVFFAAYVLLFSIVIMNLLIGLAVSDIGALMEIARRESIISQINMINEMSDRRSTILYRYCLPQCVKKLFEGWASESFSPLMAQYDKNLFRILQVNEDFKIMTVSFADINDKQFTERLKERLFNHCIR